MIAVQEFMDGQYDEMLVSAQVSADGGSSVGNALLAIASTKSKNGSGDEASRALERMAQLRPELAQDPAAVFRRHGVVDEIATKLVSGLQEAGWHTSISTN